MVSMLTISESVAALTSLGIRLRNARIQRNESMEIFAKRIGVSRPTLRDMERGAPTVQIGHWMNAFWALDRLGETSALIEEKTTLIERAKAPQKPPRKRAAPKRRKAP